MIRTNVHLTEQQLADLRAISDRTGLPVAEIVRRAVDTYIAKAEHLARAEWARTMSHK